MLSVVSMIACTPENAKTDLKVDMAIWLSKKKTDTLEEREGEEEINETDHVFKLVRLFGFINWVNDEISVGTYKTTWYMHCYVERRKQVPYQMYF